MKSSAKAEFERILEACRAEFAPQSVDEQFLVETVAHARWKLQMLEQMRARVDRPEMVDRLAASTRKSHDRALRELQRRPKRAARSGRKPANEPGAVTDTAYRA